MIAKRISIMKRKYAITIEKLVAGGFGLGRLLDDKVVMTPYVLPGEEVIITPYKNRKQYVKARLVEVIKPSLQRSEPLCPLYGRCGGCDFQHIRYDFQPSFKNEIVKDLFLRSQISQHITIPDVFQTPLSSPTFFNYRQRIRLQVKNTIFGFFRPQSHLIENVTKCALARPEINKALADLSKYQNLKGLLTHISAIELLLSPNEERLVLIIHADRKSCPADRAIVRDLLKEIPLIKKAVIDAKEQGVTEIVLKESPADDGLIRFTLPAHATGRKELQLTVEPGGFCQVNLEQNENLVRILLNWAAISPQDRVLDLFCGMGNFSLPIALWAGEVVGFDMQRSAIRSAERNAQLCNINNARFERGTAYQGAKKLIEQKENFDLVLLDPPRQGCIEVIPLIRKLKAKKVIYISCDPATLLRDLLLLAGEGFVLSHLQVVDMFPQTHHIEVITCLNRY